ncbi:hypothetical protein [Bryobacter aggregatus]|uniref:hypothetical protein n=1 Tax=Bryobacter aggregatus TaxID=360054 RepID=UPI0012BAA313|nr:hypothetical protein [Bryobacter aggregatus]
MIKFVLLTLLALATLSAQTAPPWDNSGNNQLQGSYYFRQVIWVMTSENGSVGQAIAVYGNIVFDGNGKYTLSGAQINDSGDTAVRNLSGSGTYSISASGFGFISPLFTNAGTIYGLVSRGIFVGSSTESQYNDLFIAAKLASPLPTLSSFKGNYTMLSVDTPTGNVYDVRDSAFQLNPDGNGNIGSVNASGLIAANGSRVVNQSLTGVQYRFSNGGINLSLGGSLSNTNLIAGTKYLYLSENGDFVFGGSPTAWDMIVGVRTGTNSPNFNGLYYQAGLDQDNTQLLTNGYADIYSFYGSLKASSGVLLNHQRLISGYDLVPYEYTDSGTFTIKPDGTYEDPANRYFFSPGAAVRIGLGIGSSLGVNVAVQAPSFTPSGVFIDPTGILNAASSALFTAGVAPGELLSIYGSGLASVPVADSSFPFELGGVKVLINDRPAPIYAVSPTQISAVVPFGTSENIAAIQVVNQGVASNKVTSYVNRTAPGVFTQPPGGIGTAAALHPDYSLITTDKPALIGEAIAIYVTGLGTMSPAVGDGQPGPVNPLSVATNPISVRIGGLPATITFVGLAPQLVGLNQINVIIPAGVTAGNARLEISGPDFIGAGAVLPVGAAQP